MLNLQHFLAVNIYLIMTVKCFKIPFQYQMLYMVNLKVTYSIIQIPNPQDNTAERSVALVITKLVATKSGVCKWTSGCTYGTAELGWRYKKTLLWWTLPVLHDSEWRKCRVKMSEEHSAADVLVVLIPSLILLYMSCQMGVHHADVWVVEFEANSYSTFIALKT